MASWHRGIEGKGIVKILPHVEDDAVGARLVPHEGIVHWDLLTKEGLEIAAGVYVYYLKSHNTGKEKMGKFAIIK